MRAPKILFVFLLASALFTAAHAQPLDAARLDQFFDRLAAKNKAMGSLAIVKDGEVLYTRTIGYSRIDGATRTPLTAASRFRIGSITKMYTATMLLQLADEGKLKLSDTLDKFVPQVPNAGKITLLQILSHRSGLPNVRREREPGGPSPGTRPMSHDEMLALIAKAPPDFEPGTNHGYSNSGFFLLGLVVEKVTGASYAHALAERITARLGLADTYVATGPIDVTQNESLTYFLLGDEWRSMAETHPSVLFGAGFIVSTPRDMARFIQALFDGKLVSPENLDRMKTIRDGDGLGLEPFSFAGKTFYGHTGGADNYGAWLAYLPEEKLAVAYATNAKVYPVGDIVRGVVELYYHQPFQIPSFAGVVVGPEILEQYVGVYLASDAPVKFTITREGSTLYAQPPGTSSALPLEATAEDKFKLEGPGVVFEFDAAKNQMTVKRRGGERVFQKEP